MGNTASRQRLYAALLGAGACILLFRTTLMTAQGYLGILLPWLSGLLLVEMALDLGCLLGSIRWWVAGDGARARLPLRLGAAATILHAVRVLIYALGRTAPLLNFDVRPERRAVDAGLALLDVDRDQLDGEGQALLQAPEQVQQAVAVLAAAQGDQDAIARGQHSVRDAGARQASDQALLEAPGVVALAHGVGL